jgi:hypothetical protein
MDFEHLEASGSDTVLETAIEQLVQVLVAAFDRSMHEDSVSYFFAKIKDLSQAFYNIIQLLKNYGWREKTALVFLVRYCFMNAGASSTVNYEQIGQMSAGDFEQLKHQLAVVLHSRTELESYFFNFVTALRTNIAPLISVCISKYCGALVSALDKSE